LVLAGLAKGEFDDDGATSSAGGALIAPARVAISFDGAAMKALDAAEAYVAKEHAAHDQQAVTFHGFGKSAIKKMGFSPDAFAQMAIQLGYYNMHATVGGTYESVMTRGFLHGRTEVARSCRCALTDRCMDYCDFFCPGVRLLISNVL
tara:strand:+ start:407 stop:850 length:444 start_codon:yes stop_codon:yes gene_type:complete